MTKEAVLLQIMELRESYSALYYDDEEKNFYRISGNLEFSATFEGETVEDSYQILILVPKSFPRKLPMIKETGGIIPSSFHTNPDETLCLEAPIKLYMDFNKRPTLLHFVESCAIPFFFSYSYLQEKGELPFGERAHGGKGLLKMYKEYFQIDDNKITLKLIKILAENKYKGSNLCPCPSRKKLHQCHGPLLMKIQQLQGSKYFSAEYVQMLLYLDENHIEIEKDLLSDTAFKKAKELSN